MINNYRKTIYIFLAIVLSSAVIFSIENSSQFAKKIASKYPKYSERSINEFIEKGSNKYLGELQLEKLFFKKTVFDQTMDQLNKINQPSLKARLYFYLGTLSTEVMIGEEDEIAKYFKKALTLNPSFE
ncbi:MAG: hypothetical protein U9N34_05755, partial [Candidatus Cloacimonadota bacterium]|nr:hypothetical protein [Candidatus Cloacimonadota bacterium]